MLGYPGASCMAGELWQHLLETTLFADAQAAAPWREPLGNIITRGCLSRRILDAVGADYRREALRDVYGRLCRCLERGTLFEG